MRKIINTFVLFSVFIFQSSYAIQEVIQDPIVKFKTNYGDIRLQLFPEKAPKTVENFLGLVEQKKYDRNIFHNSPSNLKVAVMQMTAFAYPCFTYNITEDLISQQG